MKSSEKVNINRAFRFVVRARQFFEFFVPFTAIVMFGIVMHQQVNDDLEISVLNEELTTLLQLENEYERKTLKLNNESLGALLRFDVTFANTGDKPILKDDVMSELTVTALDGKSFIDAQSTSDLVRLQLRGDTLGVEFDYLNPDDEFTVSLYKEERTDLNYKIRTLGISEVNRLILNDFKPLTNRVFDVHWFIHVAFGLTLLFYIDSRLVLRSDKDFAKVLKFLESTSNCKKLNVDLFLEELSSVYDKWYSNAPCILMPTESMIKTIKSGINTKNANNQKKVAEVCYTARMNVRHLNLYDTRAMFIQPLAGVIISFIGYAYYLVPWDYFTYTYWS